MYASTLTLTNDFKKKSAKGISTIRKGELTWEKLEQADKEGRLQLCSRREQLGNLVGITNKKKAYTWAANMINRGAITEDVRGFEGRQALYEYHLGKKPDYSHNGGKRKVEEENTKETYYELKQRMEKPKMELKTETETKTETQISLAASNDVTITIGNITIGVNKADVDYIVTLIKKLCE